MNLQSLASVAVTIAALSLAGCGRRDEPHAGGSEGGQHDHHASSHEPFDKAQGSWRSLRVRSADMGASHESADHRKVVLPEETQRLLGLEVAQAVEENLPQQLRFNVQIFGETHRHALREEDHAGCDAHGSGFLPLEQAALVQAQQAVRLVSATNQVLHGVVLRVQKSLALGEPEVIVGITNAGAKVKGGEFLTATVSIPRSAPVLVVPRSAILRSSEGNFVYTLEGDAFMRVPVTLGAEAEGKVEVTDGLRLGDQIVTKPVQSLWLIELRLAKGGGHSH